MEDRKRELLIAVTQILLCAAYVFFLFSQEIKNIQKQNAKVRSARAREQIRLDRQRYRSRQEMYRRQQKVSRNGTGGRWSGVR